MKHLESSANSSTESHLKIFLTSLVQNGLMLREKEVYLSLATSETPIVQTLE